MRGARRFIGHGGGAAAVEFALIGLPFIMLLLGLVEFGRGLHIRTAIDAAADRAQRTILIDPAASAGTIEAAIKNGFMAGPSDMLVVTNRTETAGGIDYRVVTVTFPMTLFLPAPLGGVISIGSNRRVALAD